MNYKTEIDYNNDGWKIFLFPTFKLHVNHKRNSSELYNLNGFNITSHCQDKIDTLFSNQLNHYSDMINEIGIDPYALARRDNERVAFLFSFGERDKKWNRVVFRFYGNILSSSGRKPDDIILNIGNIELKFKVLDDKNTIEKMILEIDFEGYENNLLPTSS